MVSLTFYEEIVHEDAAIRFKAMRKYSESLQKCGFEEMTRYKIKSLPEISPATHEGFTSEKNHVIQ